MISNNDILRRLRYAFDFGDDQMMNIFKKGDLIASRSEVSNWLKKDDNEHFVELSDRQLSIFLNGFISYKRGKKEGPSPEPEAELSNNAILRKLKIALSYRDDDMLMILELAGLRISKHELSAFFRKPHQRQYRECHDQILRNFIRGLQLKYRGKSNKTSAN